MKFWDTPKNKDNKVKFLLLVEPGGIGDYILIRPYLKFIKQSPKYKNYKIIYLAKDSYIDFVRAYDYEQFDYMIPYNVQALDDSRDYRRYLIKKLNEFNIDTILNLRTIIIPNHPDWGVRKKLIKNIRANRKIADVIKLRSSKKYEKKLDIYTDVIYSDNDFIFEFERHRLFFEKFLNIKIPPQDTKIDSLPDVIDNNTVLVSMGSLSEYRNLSADKCIKLLNELIVKTNYKFALLGTYNQHDINQTILTGVTHSERVINLSGKTNITQLPEILKKCALLLVAESGTLHIANAVGCKAICVSNGSYYRRYHPYPQNSNITYIYPEWFKKGIANGDLDLIDIYGGEQPWNLDDICLDDIVNAVVKI